MKKAIEKYSKLINQAYEQRDGRRLRTEFWYNGKFLPSRICNSIGDEEDCFAFMFRHTQRRPRDIIRQMQCIVDKSIEKDEFPYISQQSVKDGVHSKGLLEHIVAESLTPYEGKLPVALKKATRSLFFQRPAIMSYTDLKRFAEGIYSYAPVGDIDPERFVDVLTNCGLIGMIDERSFGQNISPIYTKAKFEYIMQGIIPLNSRFRYCIHPAMCDLFEMELPKGYKVIYPYPETLEDSWLEKEIGYV